MNQGHEHWGVECEEHRGFIALRRLHRVGEGILNLSWPVSFDVDCPYCKRPHSCMRAEITSRVFEQPLPIVPLLPSRSG